MMTFTVVEPVCPSWYWETVHTKAVRGIVKTKNRRPFRECPDGRQVKSQRYWMTQRPTTDRLWFASGPEYWRDQIAIMRRAGQTVDQKRQLIRDMGRNCR